MQLPPVVDPVRADTDTLNSLSVGFKIMGWLHGLGICAAALTLPLWIGLISAASQSPENTGFGAIAAISGLGLFVMAVIAFLPLLYLWASLKTAKNLETRTGWGFCFGTSILWLFAQPLGLVLGIIAIVILHRPSIRQSFRD